MAEGKCESCQAPVVWAEYKKSGKPGIFDATPKQGGTGFELTPDGAVYVKDAPVSTRVYESHFASCPNAKQHRSKT